MSLTPMVNVDPYDISEYQDIPESQLSGENKFEILQLENDENIPTFTIQVMSVEECDNLKFQPVEVNSDVFKVPLGDSSNTAGNALDRNENNKPKLVRPASEIAVSTINCSNSLNVKTLMKKNYYKNEQLHLECEWDDCVDSFENVEAFTKHVATHVQEAEVRHIEPSQEDVFACLWSECGFETASSDEMVRHIHFHSFHTKIKCHGLNMLTSHGLLPCTLDPSQRNIVPDLSDPYKCGWVGCEMADRQWHQPQHFYFHVCAHAEEVRGKEIRCNWLNCSKTDGSVSKLKEHMRSHSQERLVGCPTCGGLFANRVKFLDHCKRQHVSNEHSFTCNNCGKKFALERLLRDHMRSHINHYKCPQCDMTCPTPSSLSNHMRYKHVKEKPFSCEFCDYKGKTQHDVKGHMRVHYEEVELNCTESGCSFSCRAQSTMKLHFMKKHRNTEPNYVCHLCDKRYNRGAYLTKHLIKIHNFSWPSGHSRFRYNRDETTGLYRLQTIRFESLDLQEELQGGESLRIAETDSESIEAGDSIRSASPGDQMLYRTSSPIPLNIGSKSRGDFSSAYSEDGGSSAWSQDQGSSYRSSQALEGSYRSSQDGDGDHALSFQSSHEDAYGVKFPLDPLQ
eukprot:GFUD01018700.1.p1 GENE.GFUD01018700.1~~GFUD01018700.1.p1  ORF type:complete len:622 (-),score=135.52 GFUD01018700.1:151-2016(-)